MATQSSTISDDGLIPRRYQEEIFEKAVRGNVIAALDTGSGKTLISTLLIKWVSTQERAHKKLVVFLVPKVALAQQQGAFIAKHSPLRVKQATGATAPDMSDRLGWQELLSDVDVIVLTAQLFLNVITHSHWTINEVSLLIFDECHHTRKNHAYNGIMREYYQCPTDQRPKIFGMTASPIWNAKDAVNSLVALEKNLNATVVAVRDHATELSDYSPRPKEIIKQYSSPPMEYPSYPVPTLWNRCDTIPRSPDIAIPWVKIQTRYRVAYESLGPCGAEMFLHAELKQQVRYLLDTAVPDGGFALELEPRPLRVNGGGNRPDLVKKLDQILQLLTQYDGHFAGATGKALDPTWCTPKVIALVDILLDNYHEDFQSIVFVEQRHVATSLAELINRLPNATGRLKCAVLLGHGATDNSAASIKGMPTRVQGDVVRMFRKREVNVLLATSVAEEGLDFPACDLVIRFDPVQHMVGYVQSRGRARHHTSTFVILVEEGNAHQLARYQALKKSEPELRLIYQTRDTTTVGDSFEDDGTSDASLGERYVVPKTGAILSYATATSLLNRLCALIPRDTFTPPQTPRYAGDFVSTLTLPASLPLPQELLTFTGPEKPTKREAKRAVAFMAVKRLHELNVFDDYMLPSKGSRARVYEDADGRPVPSTKNLPDMLDVLVRDPWVLNDKNFLHVIYVDGVPTAGLLTGSSLPQVEMTIQDALFIMEVGTPFEIQQPQEWDKLRMFQDYTRAGLWWCVTHRNISTPVAACMVPLTEGLLPDFTAIQEAVDNPFGSHDWSTIDERHHDNLLVMNGKVHGRPLLLRSVRRDLTPMSPPAPGSREACFPTYREYWIQKYTRKGIEPIIPPDCPLIEIQHFPREQSSLYSTESLRGVDGSQPSIPVGPKSLLPLYLCRQLSIPKAMWKTFRVLPILMRRATDLWRARQAVVELSLPPMQLHILAEALTLPCANASFDNQRLETLGDSVLKLCTVVYIFHKFPFRHEGQLDAIRRCCVSNRTLLARAQAIGLERFLSPEIQSMRVWPYTVHGNCDPSQARGGRLVERSFPRRSLQECMESTLGAAFLSGGIPAALRAGVALGLSFGGPVPWPLRYGWRLKHVNVSPLFTSLTERLGYEFKCGNLLIEAASHPSFQYTALPSYQRLEFLGDALIELVIMRYLYHRFPKATSGDLTTAKGRLVRNAALASVAVKKLELHKVILLNNASLSAAIWSSAKLLQETSYAEIVVNGWKYEPPKALGDVFESVMGAVFVDTGHNFEKFSVIVEMIMEELLNEIEMDLPLDPVSNLMIWMSKNGCRRVNFQKGSRHPQIKTADTVLVMVHGIAVTEPIWARTKAVSKALAAEMALKVLEDKSSDYYLPRLCDCNAKGSEVQSAVGIGEDEEEDEEGEAEGGDEGLVEDAVQKDETEEGFAVLAQGLVNTRKGGSSRAEADRRESSDMGLSEDEVEVH
ncbi:hypothetical protein BDM02DRAFT_3180798 [Thelephora ganbajun]|uniref:Uncharacterized protein n=1 Tax=Thelephora ganbajun TaxID=370292 RepID=A0ACB6ZBS5_THEGA|nr:hypothetical protein BDM02DRAFT_3180798 [Thelephora ganbajun]